MTIGHRTTPTVRRLAETQRSNCDLDSNHDFEGDGNGGIGASNGHDGSEGLVV
jgi:hypothetical protein